jgi:hypothetical protein
MEGLGGGEAQGVADPKKTTTKKKTFSSRWKPEVFSIFYIQLSTY